MPSDSEPARRPLLSLNPSPTCPTPPSLEQARATMIPTTATVLIDLSPNRMDPVTVAARKAHEAAHDRGEVPRTELRVEQVPPALARTVAVERRHPRGHQAVCECGQLLARRRLLRGFAVADALTHAAQTGCAPAEPLSSPRITVA